MAFIAVAKSASDSRFRRADFIRSVEWDGSMCPRSAGDKIESGTLIAFSRALTLESRLSKSLFVSARNDKAAAVLVVRSCRRRSPNASFHTEAKKSKASGKAAAIPALPLRIVDSLTKIEPDDDIRGTVPLRLRSITEWR